MKIQIVANTCDENGRYNPCPHRHPDMNPGCLCDVVDLPEAAAIDYLNRGLAVPYKEPVIKRPESRASQRETADVKAGKGKRQESGEKELEGELEQEPDEPAKT